MARRHPQHYERAHSWHPLIYGIVYHIYSASPQWGVITCYSGQGEENLQTTCMLSRSAPLRNEACRNHPDREPSEGNTSNSGGRKWKHIFDHRAKLQARSSFCLESGACLFQTSHFLAILYRTSLANLVVEVGTRHCHQILLFT